MLTPIGSYYEIDVVDPKANAFLTLHHEIFNKICKMLYPADRARLSSTCRQAYTWICTDQGASIWHDTGSVGAARDLRNLSNEIMVTSKKDDPEAQITILALALVWPRGFCPAKKSLNSSLTQAKFLEFTATLTIRNPLY